MNEVSINFIGLIIGCVSVLLGYGITMLCIRYKHKREQTVDTEPRMNLPRFGAISGNTITVKEDFLPKKKMKVHKIDQGIRKEAFRIHSPIGPGIYVREVDNGEEVSQDELDNLVPLQGFNLIEGNLVRRNRENE